MGLVSTHDPVRPDRREAAVPQLVDVAEKIRG
jgi:hypothetical protein